MDLNLPYWVFIYPNLMGAKGGLNDLHSTHEHLRDALDEVGWYHRHRGMCLWHIFNTKKNKIVDKDRIQPLEESVQSLWNSN